MVIETSLNLIIADTISGIIKNLPFFFLLIWGFKIIAKEIKEGVKQIPSWMKQYHKERMEELTLERIAHLK
jgi:predicted PurR-regulated permease PerM